MNNLNFANKGNILNPENVPSWGKEEIECFGPNKAREIFADRARRAKALIPAYVRYVDHTMEAFYHQAAQMWQDASNFAPEK